MKKYLVVFLLFFPAISFGVPSVRMLGSVQPVAAQPATATKLTPAKSSVENAKPVSIGRAASLQAKSKVSSLTSGAGTSSTSRFPIITAAHSYNSVTSPQATGGSTGSSSVNVDTIIQAVTNNIENNYYTKEEVNNLIQQGSTVDIDPRMFDVVRTSNPAQAHNADAPSGFVYIWIEENNN